MTRTLLFLAAHLALPIFGAPAAFHPSVRRLSLPARTAAAFGAGAVLLTLLMTLFSIAGIRWSVAALSLPLLVFSLGASAMWAKRSFRREDRLRPARGVAAAAALAAGLGLAHLGLALATARATSPDFLLFWGVKGARFAAAGGFDSELLRSLFSYHLVPDYPPLVPAVFSWSTLLAGEMPWRFVPLSSALWALAAVPLVVSLLRRRLPDEQALGIAAFWTVALAVSLVHSGSGGNAEAPLLFFETLAIAALLAEGTEDDSSRFLPALALAGAALTKVEGSAAVAFVVIGVVVRDLLERRKRVLARALPLALAPAAALSVWFAFQALSGLEPGYRPHGSLWVLYPEHLPAIGRAFLRHLQAGTFGLSWILPLGLLLLRGGRLRAALPAFTLAAGLLLFFAFDYLHDASDPSIRIHWTLPRVSQPCLSAAILAAGIVTGSRPGSRDASAGWKRRGEEA